MDFYGGKGDDYMSPIDKGRKYTADEYFSRTDLEGTYELVSGEIYDMSPAPNRYHQRLSIRIATLIQNYIDENSGDCEVYASPADVKLNEEDVFQPDLFVICDPSKYDKQKYNGAPDWVIEILSPSNAQHDLITKLEKYKKAGVREYWVVDPDTERVVVHPFEEEKATGIYTFDDEVPVGIYKGKNPQLTICLNKYKWK